MVVIGKPMGNGYPVGGVAIKPDLLAAFGTQNGYFNTFGGSPAAAAAGLAVLETIESEGLQKNSLDIGRYLLGELNRVAKRHERVGDVRGAGLYIGVEFVRDPKSKAPDAKAAHRIVNLMRERNILIGTAGRHGNVLKIRPPLCLQKEHADMLASGFADALSASAKR
jgi:4-aminobutyrate aminotransferase-like enzyme